MRYTVQAPVKEFTGEVAGVHLVKGSYTGELTPSALAYFQGAGYKVEAEEAPQAEEGGKTPSRSASKADWLKHAVENGMTEADAEALTRDQLAEKFLGPKPE
ncbi:hypothetical protein ACGFI9_37230 [Micromonospora sp. NPDC048930]|uniref:hypothetical protein n=1 Tax=Micromonospora sp. NPDC048930 TaxID=3364261 RepID=UPI003711D9F6